MATWNDASGYTWDELNTWDDPIPDLIDWTGSGGVVLGGAASVRFSTTFVEGSGGIEVGGSATWRVSETAVPANVTIEWDFDNDGDFDESVEDITNYVMELETRTGRDWPSLLTGRAGPGELTLTLVNTDYRFNYFNTSSPLNQAPFSLKTGRKIRVRTTATNYSDPSLYVRDRFWDADQEVGSGWFSAGGGTGSFQRADGVATLAYQQARDATEVMSITELPTTDYYAQLRLSELGPAIGTAAGTVGLVYRYVDADNFSMIVTNILDESVDLVDVVAGTSTVIDSTIMIKPYADMILGVHVVGSTVTGYINGVEMLGGTALNTSSDWVGMYAQVPNAAHAFPAISEFYAWSGLPQEVEGIIWTGTVDEVINHVRVDEIDTVTVKAVGPLGRLATEITRPPASTDGMVTGFAVGDVLASANLLHPPTPLDRGDLGTGAFGFDDISALEIARQFEEAEYGFLYETPEGYIGFDSRTARDARTSQATFADNSSAQFAYREFTSHDWRRELFNKVEAGLSAAKVDIVFHEFQTGTIDASNHVDYQPSAVTGEGDLILLFISASFPSGAQFEWESPAGWESIDGLNEQGSGKSTSFKIFARVCDVTESLQNNIFGKITSSSSPSGEAGSFVVLAIRILAPLLNDGWYGSIKDGVSVSDFNVNYVANSDWEANSPPVFPDWGVDSPSFFVTALFGADIRTAGSGTPSADAHPPRGYVPRTDSASTTFLTTTTNTATTLDYFNGLAFGVRNDVTSMEDPWYWLRGTAGGASFHYLENPNWTYGTRGVVTVAVRGYNGSPPSQNPRTVTVEDRDSQVDYNLVNMYRESAEMFDDEDDATTYANLVLSRHAEARPIFTMSFVSSRSASQRSQAIRRRLGDKITVDATNATGQGFSGDFFIENISHHIIDGGRFWETTWDLSPA